MSEAHGCNVVFAMEKLPSLGSSWRDDLIPLVEWILSNDSSDGEYATLVR